MKREEENGRKLAELNIDTATSTLAFRARGHPSSREGGFPGPPKLKNRKSM